MSHLFCPHSTIQLQFLWGIVILNSRNLEAFGRSRILVNRELKVLDCSQTLTFADRGKSYTGDNLDLFYLNWIHWWVNEFVFSEFIRYQVTKCFRGCAAIVKKESILRFISQWFGLTFESNCVESGQYFLYDCKQFVLFTSTVESASRWASVRRASATQHAG